LYFGGGVAPSSGKWPVSGLDRRSLTKTIAASTAKPTSTPTKMPAIEPPLVLFLFLDDDGGFDVEDNSPLSLYAILTTSTSLLQQSLLVPQHHVSLSVLPV
jgi:hypothetical protein